MLLFPYDRIFGQKSVVCLMYIFSGVDILCSLITLVESSKLLKVPRRMRVKNGSPLVANVEIMSMQIYTSLLIIIYGI